ncbi:Adaptive-response sensory-kinase SasA [wastewater metagenome]|uniref:histidine kinase n=2 Tax=unclassified sequences TaxID=12908 RepID=A0A5B8R5Z9_9ZZZZ|nr:ATP-binding protein [Arhodomonas sp. KWT]QEA03996.1 adaptive-response sensory-kinase SasA [uncultured organism]
MAIAGFLKRLKSEGAVRLALCVALLVSLYLLNAATENSAMFGQLYSWLLLFNAVALVALVTVIGVNVWRLVRSLREARPGSRLTGRIMALFALLAVVPGLIVYAFSMQFLRSGIDSWFDVRVEQALDDALSLSQASLDLRMRDLLKRVQSAADELTTVPEGTMTFTIGDLRERMNAAELTLFGSNGRIIASSTRDTESILPNRPEDEVLLQLRQGRPYVSLDPIEGSGLNIRAAVPAPNPAQPQNPRFLLALFPISPRLNELAGDVQQAFAQYRELAYLRGPLKDSFILTLSLVLLMSLLFAVWSAFYLARRLVAPISGLAEGTRALAEGDYGTQLPDGGRDELGFLVRSFNEMSRRVAQSRDEARRGQVLAEAQRAYLETVLGRLSSGVLALDQYGRLRTYNQAAVDILSVPLAQAAGGRLRVLVSNHPAFEPFVELVEARSAAGGGEWREEFTLDTDEGRRMLICSGAALPGGRTAGGHVIVFDDVTTLIQAQRDAAWGEVARRLAHEIRNPLTPIQLSAERLQHKLSDRLEAEDAERLERATRTIIQQVDAMKAMVNAFSEYARPPRLSLVDVDLNALVQDVVELHRGDDTTEVAFTLDLAGDLPTLRADPGRLRQLLNNLIRNALEAADGEGRPCRLTVTTRTGTGRYAGQVELCLTDNGPGFAEAVLDQLFEPYVTTKPRGSGLGLAIVKKIVEEHNGRISARNLRDGARITVRLPVAGEPHRALVRSTVEERG